MALSTKTSTEPFIRVRLIRFSDGIQIQPLENIKLRIDTFDLLQVSSNRPKFPEYDKKADRFCFETRTKQGRQIIINVYIDIKKTNYIYKTSIEDLIRHADEIIREYRFSDKSRGWMSIELITPNNIRQAQRIVHDRIRKHYGHEFLPKGFNTPGYRCQLCDLVVHERCINHVATCKQLTILNPVSMATIPHKFLREPNFFPVFCDHDGKIIRPLRAWKCSECGMIVHSRCKSNVAQFCGTRKIAVQMYEEWKEQNKSTSDNTYISPDECTTVEIEEKNRKLLINIYERLQHGCERNDAIKDLNLITKSYELSENSNQNVTSYYNKSIVLLHGLTFYGKLGHGFSGSVYWVKYSGRDYALKALRKHRIFEANEYDCVKSERDVLILTREYPFIIQLYAVFHDFQRVYFLFEYAPYGTFYDFLFKIGSTFDDPCIQWFSGQIICALRYLHSKLVIHRDLKPENVLLMRDGRIKLADFGFCKQLTSKTETARTFCGTAEYIAPEIYRYLNYSFPVDYWSLGIMIYEMIVLHTPFYHSNEIEIKDHVINGDFQLPDNISSDLQSILIGLLRKNPSERFGINELQSSNYYSLEEIEKGNFKCPLKRSIPLNSSSDKYLSTQQIHLSDIDEQSLCTTLTVDRDKFRNFSFIAF